ncbi:MAG: ELM1/GtrOC1 family putative glycosyltransferase [Sphingomicrobium sp.]
MNEDPLPRIWLLLGPRRGDNNQLLALGEGLGLPFETRTLDYRKSARAIMRLVPRSIRHLDPQSRAWLAPPWPDLVIGIGRRSVPVARWIREQSKGAARLVRLGHPRAPSQWFDLVITTQQYPVRDAKNVVRLPIAMNRFALPPAPTAAEQSSLDSLPRPHFLLSLGGNAPMWRLDHQALGQAVQTLLARARRERGSLIVIPSPRTSDEALALVRAEIGKSGAGIVAGNSLRYAVALADADEHFVTADSVSMISEAIATGKPVGLIPVEPDARGHLRLRGDPEDSRLRDPRRFWLHVEALGLVGNVAHPRKGRVDDPVAMAVDAIRARLGARFAPTR